MGTFTGDYTDGEWHFLEVTWDGSNLYGFIDGVQRATTAQSGSQGTGSSPIYVGHSNGSEYFNGELAGFRYSDAARHITAFTPPQIPLTADSDTVVLINMTEGSGATAADSSGNGFDLDLDATNPPTWSEDVPYTFFSPSDVSGLVAWYDASQLTGFSDDDPVGTWTDESGNSNDASNTLTQRPLYKTAVLNGLPVVRFDGTNDRLDMSTSMTVGAVFVVGNWSGADPFPAGYKSMFGRAAGGYNLMFGREAETNLGTSFTGGTSNIRVNGGAASGVVDYATLSTHKLAYIDTSSPSTNSDWHIASGDALDEYWFGDMAEIIVYSAALSDTDREAVEDYLNAKWNLGF